MVLRPVLASHVATSRSLFAEETAAASGAHAGARSHTASGPATTRAGFFGSSPFFVLVSARAANQDEAHLQKGRPTAHHLIEIPGSDGLRLWPDDNIDMRSNGASAQ